MPYQDPDPADPMTLHGVAVQTDGDDAVHEMAECFVEECARIGFDEERILRIFSQPGYAGPFLVRQALGEDKIRSLIKECAQRRGGFRKACPEASPEGTVCLPVLG